MATNPASEERELGSFDHSSKSRRRKRSVFNKEQITVLVNYFAKNRYPGIEEREQLSRLINVPESQIQIWFQNRRARHRIEPKKRSSEDSISSGKQICLENVSLSPILEEDFSEQNLVMPSEFRYLTWAGEPGQEAIPKRSCSFERSAALTTEAACMDGYGISPNAHFVSSQTMRPATELQPNDLPRPVYQGSSQKLASSWGLQETNKPENYGSCTSFFGEVKPPIHQQEQRWTREQFYPYYHSVPFQYTQEPPHQLQQPYPQKHPIIQQPTPSQFQSPQEFQGQTQLPLLVRKEEQQKEPLFSFEQQELHHIDLYKKTVGCGSTFLHSGYLISPRGDVTASMGHVVTPMDDVAAPQEAVASPQGNMTDYQGDVETLLEDFTAPLGDVAASLGDVDTPQGHMIDHQGDEAAPQGHLTEDWDMSALMGDLPFREM